MTYIDVHAPNGTHLFTYDPARRLVQIKVKGLGHAEVLLAWCRVDQGKPAHPARYVPICLRLPG